MLQQGKYFKQLYYRNLNTLSLSSPVLLSGNVQSEQFAAGESVHINDIIGPLTLLVSVDQCYFQVTSNLNMSQQGNGFKQ